MNVWIAAFFHLIYRTIRFFLHAIQSLIFWRFNGVNNHLSKILNGKAPEDCHVLSILYRKRLVDGDMGGAIDFVWWHDKFVSSTQILGPDPHWTLYTVDENYAYFVRMPEPWPYYHARNAPFAFMRQFEDGTKLARMPHKVFCRFAEKDLPEPKGPVVYFSNAARSGTTLLARIMQVSEKHIRSFSEPDAFDALISFHQRGLIDDSVAQDLIKAMFKFYCKTQEPGQTYLMKTPSNGGYLVPMIKKVMPRVKHMFMFRRNTRRVLSSVEKIVRGATAGDVCVKLWNIWPELSARFFNAGSYEYDLCLRFGIKDPLDIALIMHVASWYYYHRCRDSYDIPIIYYEDLIAEKEKTLRLVFDLCEIPFDEFIDEALKEFSMDSQEGTALSQDSMKGVKDTPLDESKIRKMNEMCDELNVPRIPV